MNWNKALGLPDAGDGLPPGAPRGRQAELVMWGEWLQEFRTFMQTHTQAVARLAGRMTNDTLEVRSDTFTSDASIERSFHVAAGCVYVDNYSQHDVVLAVGGRTGGNAAPPPGIGIYRIKAGTGRPVNIASKIFTLYGTSGDEIAWQVFTTGGIVPGAALSGINGGGA